MTTAKLILLLSFLTTAPLISVGCSAGNTYVKAIGSWESAPVEQQALATTQDVATKSSPMAWMKAVASKVKEQITADFQLTIDPSGAYVAQVHGREINGQLEITSIFGDGLGVSTDFGSMRKEARVRIVGEDRMVVESAGTEITLVRTR